MVLRMESELCDKWGAFRNWDMSNTDFGLMKNAAAMSVPVCIVFLSVTVCVYCVCVECVVCSKKVYAGT